MTPVDPESPDLEALDAAVRTALATGDETGIRVLGYGEISAVVAWPADAPRWACKRLPPFRDGAQLDAYTACLDRYIAALGEAGIDVVDSELQAIETPAGLVAYIIQPALPGERLGPTFLRQASEADATAVLERIATHVVEGVGARLGLDAQLSNWLVHDDGTLSYLDLTTPLMRDAEGRDQLDADLFLASLPWLLRGFVHRFILRGVLDKYFEPRGVVLDLLGNLHKERLAELIEPALPALNAITGASTPGGSVSPLTPREIARYYRSDARTWALLQRLRKLDRWWQRRVRRRTYPFLIPARIAR